MKYFDKSKLKKLYKPAWNSSGEDNGQVTIIGGSELFHGAPLLALKVASRIVDMVFFTTPEKSVGHVAEQMKSKLLSFIWVPWEEADSYIEKSDAVLIGPGFMRYNSETQNLKFKAQNYDNAGEFTREITEKLLKNFPEKKWVIDAGSLQVIDPELLPKGCIITPNKKEFEILFGWESEITSDGGRLKQSESHDSSEVKLVRMMAKKYNCTIVLKGPETIVASPDDVVIVKGGNPGMTKGGTGDVLAGLAVAMLAKNEPFLAASAASFIAKAAADELYRKVGPNYNADDLASQIPLTLASFK